MCAETIVSVNSGCRELEEQVGGGGRVAGSGGERRGGEGHHRRWADEAAVEDRGMLSPRARPPAPPRPRVGTHAEGRG